MMMTMTTGQTCQRMLLLIVTRSRNRPPNRHHPPRATPRRVHPHRQRPTFHPHPRLSPPPPPPPNRLARAAPAPAGLGPGNRGAWSCDLTPDSTWPDLNFIMWLVSWWLLYTGKTQSDKINRCHDKLWLANFKTFWKEYFISCPLCSIFVVFFSFWWIKNAYVLDFSSDFKGCFSHLI